MSYFCRGEAYGCSHNCAKNFETNSGRYKHEQAAAEMNKQNNLNQESLKKLGGTVKSRGPSDARSNNSNDSRESRVSVREQTKADQFRSMIQLTKATKSSMKPPDMDMDNVLTFFFNRILNDPNFNTIELFQKDLKIIPQMADFAINETKRNILDVCLSNKANSIAVAEDAYEKDVKEMKESFAVTLRSKKKDSAYKLTDESSKCMKRLLGRNNNGEYIIPMESLSAEHKDIIEYSLPLLQFKKAALEKEMAHRIRLLEDEAVELLEKAILPPKIPQEEQSQDQLQWDEPAPASKKSRTR